MRRHTSSYIRQWYEMAGYALLHTHKELAARMVNEQTNSGTLFNMLASDMAEADRLSERMVKREVTRQLQRNQVGGLSAVRVWQRDCDMCEGTSIHWITPTYRQFAILHNEVAESAEGPFALAILTPEAARAFKPEFRDRALEAFEDGHPHVIYA